MITIKTKSEQLRSTILDGLRVMAWKQYKADNNVRGLEKYEEFGTEWAADPRQSMTLKELTEHLKELEFTVQEVLEIREQYYNQKNGNGNGNGGNGGNGGSNGQKAQSQQYVSNGQQAANDVPPW